MQTATRTRSASTSTVDRNVGAKLAGLDAATVSSATSGAREARLGRAPLAKEDYEVLSHGHERPRGAGESLVHGNAVEARLGEPDARFLVRGCFERKEQRLPVREVAVERPARDPRRGGDVSHRSTVAPGENAGRGLENLVSACRGPSRSGHSQPLPTVQRCYVGVTYLDNCMTLLSNRVEKRCGLEGTAACGVQARQVCRGRPPHVPCPRESSDEPAAGGMDRNA